MIFVTLSLILKNLSLGLTNVIANRLNSNNLRRAVMAEWLRI